MQFKLKVATLYRFPYFYKNKAELNEGVLYEILKILASYYNFTYEIITPDDDQYGKIENDGNWTGLMGLLVNKKADIAVADLSVTFSRFTSAEFTVPFFYDAVTFVTRNDRSLSLPNFSLAKIFSTPVWIGIILSFFIVFLTFYFDHVVDHFRKRLIASECAEYLFIFISTTLNQGEFILHLRHVFSVLITIWIISVFIFCTAFSGVLISVLTTETHGTGIVAISKLLQMMGKGRFDVVCVEGSAFLSAVKEGSTSEYRKLRDYIFSNTSRSIVASVPEGIDRVLSDDFALIFPQSLLMAEASKRGLDNFIFARDNFYSTYYTLGLQLGSEWKDRLSETILRMTDSGIVKMLFDKFLVQENLKSSSRNVQYSKNQKLGVSHLRRNFLFLLWGNGLGFLVLCLEIFIHRHKKKKHIIQRNSTFYDKLIQRVIKM